MIIDSLQPAKSASIAADGSALPSAMAGKKKSNLPTDEELRDAKAAGYKLLAIGGAWGAGAYLLHQSRKTSPHALKTLGVWVLGFWCVANTAMGAGGLALIQNEQRKRGQG